jgi:hypothetical protein
MTYNLMYTVQERNSVQRDGNVMGECVAENYMKIIELKGKHVTL